jgi:outer membrane protein TolC
MRRRFLRTKKHLVFATFLLFPIFVRGQQISRNSWTLQQVLEVSQQNNWEIKKSAQEILSQKAEFRSTLAAFLPGISISESVTQTNDPLAAFGIKLQQEIVTQSDFNPDLLNNPDDVTDFNLGVMVEQPIVNTDAFAGRRAVAYKLEAAEQKAVHLRYYIKYMVKQSYYAIQLAKARQDVLKEALEYAQENHRIAENNLEEGSVSKADVMAANVRVLDIESKVAEAEDDVVSAGQMLAFLLGLDIDTQIIPEEKLSKVQLRANPSGYNLDGRSDVLSYASGVKAREKMVTMNRLRFVPRLNAFGGYNFHSDEFPGIDAESWVIGAKLQWTIFSGNKNFAGIKQAKANAQLARLKHNEYVTKNRMEFDRAERSLNVAETTLNASVLAEEQTKEALRIRQDRYVQGLERTSDLLAAETDHSEKQLERLNALFNYNKAVFYLQYLMEIE